MNDKVENADKRKNKKARKKNPKAASKYVSGIKDMAHAKEIQQRRVDKGLRGYAKAVRNWLLREFPDDYMRARAQLPVLWDQPKEEDQAV